MKLTTAFLPVLLLTSSLASAAKPDAQPNSLLGKLAASTPLVPVPVAPKKKQSYKEMGVGLLEMLNLSMYQATGIDVKKAVGKAQNNLAFQPEEDERDGTERLHDDNWEEMVEFEEGESTVAENGKEKVWCLVVHGPKTDPMTTVFYNSHAQASNITRELKANGTDSLDLSHVRWGRVDYLNATELMTRWIIFKPPYLVFVSKRGKELRFLAPREVRPDPFLLREVLASGEWAEAPVWISKYAPAGKYGPYMNIFASYYRVWADKTAKIPRFAWLAVSGVASQSILAWLHRKNTPAPGSEEEKKVKKVVLPPLPPVAAPASDKAVAVAEAVRRRAAAAKQEEEKLAAEEARRDAEASSGLKARKGKGKK